MERMTNDTPYWKERMSAHDTIYRQAAIDGADAIIARDTSGNNDVVKAMTAWKSYVEALPSVQPEQKKGKWEYKMVNEGVIGFRCSACGDEVLLPTPFCRNCGADMRGDVNV